MSTNPIFLFIILICVFTCSICKAQHFEIDGFGTQEIARFKGGVFPYLSLYSEGHPFCKIGDLIGNRYDVGVSTAVENPSASIHLITGQVGKNITLNSQGDVGIGMLQPEAKLEVDGYTKLGSGDDFPSIKVKRVEKISDGFEYSSIQHGLSNGHKISQVFIRASIYVEATDRWEYVQLPPTIWLDDRIAFDQRPISSFGHPRAGQLIKAIIMYEDQGEGVD